MVYVFTTGDAGALRRIPAGTADLIIFVTDKLSTRSVKRLSFLAFPSLAEGGELIVASSLPDAVEKL